jgi:hypothetical protein
MNKSIFSKHFVDPDRPNEQKMEKEDSIKAIPMEEEKTKKLLVIHGIVSYNAMPID